MKRPLLIAVAVAALSLPIAAAVSAQTEAASPAVAAALADPGRPAEDKARDAARKAAETVAFAQVKPNGQVADFVMGGGYFTRIFAKVVGEAGKVYAFQPDEFVAYQASYGTDQDKVAAAYPNVVKLRSAFAAPALPAGTLDVVFTAQNYHDLHLKPFAADTAARANAAIFRALKPGGVYVIIDHYAAADSGLSAAHELHRIDIEAVKKEVTAAGFVLDAESDMLRNPADPRTASVFDPSIKGKTDQFMLRFRKPG